MSALHHLHAIFASLQGEGRNMGRPCAFIRYTSCNLACPWCDTRKNETLCLATPQVVAEVRKLGQTSVIVTGGEPTIQPGLDELVVALKAAGCWVALETNGVRAPAHPEHFDYIAVSPKADYPARYLDAAMIRRADEVRIVATSEDLAPFCRSMRTRIAADNYYISPLESDGRIHYRRALKLLSRVNKSSGDVLPPWSLSIQMHKVLGIR